MYMQRTRWLQSVFRPTDARLSMPSVLILVLAVSLVGGLLVSLLGGLISLYAYFRRPEVFGLAGVFSPALRWGKRGIYPFVNRAEFSPGKIYVDVGTAEDDIAVLAIHILP